MRFPLCLHADQLPHSRFPPKLGLFSPYIEQTAISAQCALFPSDWARIMGGHVPITLVGPSHRRCGQTIKGGDSRRRSSRLLAFSINPERKRDRHDARLHFGLLFHGPRNLAPNARFVPYIRVPLPALFVVVSAVRASSASFPSRLPVNHPPSPRADALFARK